MSGHCEFLVAKSVHGADMLFHCEAGVNFYALGDGTTLCPTCPIPAIRAVPRCQHLEYYAFLVVPSDGARSVESGYGCLLHGWGLLSPSECTRCADYEEAQR